jgi:hypothetical protein
VFGITVKVLKKYRKNLVWEGGKKKNNCDNTSHLVYLFERLYYGIGVTEHDIHNTTNKLSEYMTTRINKNMLHEQCTSHECIALHGGRGNELIYSLIFVAVRKSLLSTKKS